jgi:RIO kinase 1
VNDYTTHDFEDYEDLFDPAHTDRRARRSRKPRQKPVERKGQTEIVEEIAETTGLEEGFSPTYRPSKYEQGWLLSSLEGFYDQQIITDVLSQVRGGKEASVYCCAAHPSTGRDLIAAKVYRPRQFRQLRNDKMYREGRAILTEEGRPVKENDHRVMRAIGKKTAFGAQVSHTSWLMYEYTTLGRLYAAGAAVPQPIASSENAILMSYCGNDSSAAPLLSEVRLAHEEAAPLFDEVMRNVEIMLRHGLIHGDLSAYNILYWEGTITLIDFPQVTDPQSNPNARFILGRDIERVCDYFARYGLERPARTITNRLWYRYAAPRAEDLAADLSRHLEDPVPGD